MYCHIVRLCRSLAIVGSDCIDTPEAGGQAESSSIPVEADYALRIGWLGAEADNLAGWSC